MDRIVRPVERLTYRLCGIDETREMGVTGYAVSLLVFNLAVLLFIYVILRLQGHLPFNPAHIPDMSPTVAFNTAVSFATNTNWQVYVPESSVSYLSQMLGLARENFVSGAVGMAVAVAFIRGHHAPLGPRARQLLGRHDAQLPLRAAADLDHHRAGPRLAGRRAEPERADSRGHRPGHSADHRPGALRLAGDPSRSSAPTAAAPTTPTRRIPTRTRRRCPTSSRTWRCWPSRSPSPTRSGASPATSDRGGRCSPRPW